MAEQIEKTGNGAEGARSQPLKSVKKEAQNIADQAAAAGRDIKDRVVGLAEDSVDAARAKAEDLAGAAREFPSEAGETIKERANSQREAGADYIGGIADAIRRASREFDNDMPIAGVYMRKAAAKVEDISDTVQRGDISELVKGVQDFARRQPTAFLGLAVLAGFGAVRFLKSSSSAGDQSYRAASRDDRDDRS
ncbi:hypothetical protein [Rhodopseudomonas pseudopalustris]|uniref:Uncharacterized protein n=1 Tax=Rhodopseudomonas pseudopalustris TaxID=1513892 RepID=A0A1H8WQA3_9BRAD|nr:hypothetical protein [Rhodopseudomonas pseudopalustris]SEP29789.1 hypothetical protein SAMN05444123_11385 [Rhodopseudomonas pseudopalustris]